MERTQVALNFLEEGGLDRGWVLRPLEPDFGDADAAVDRVDRAGPRVVGRQRID